MDGSCLPVDGNPIWLFTLLSFTRHQSPWIPSLMPTHANANGCNELAHYIPCDGSTCRFSDGLRAPKFHLTTFLPCVWGFFSGVSFTGRIMTLFGNEVSKLQSELLELMKMKLLKKWGHYLYAAILCLTMRELSNQRIRSNSWAEIPVRLFINNWWSSSFAWIHDSYIVYSTEILMLMSTMFMWH